jgi:hypothetical protein
VRGGGDVGQASDPFADILGGGFAVGPDLEGSPGQRTGPGNPTYPGTDPGGGQDSGRTAPVTGSTTWIPPDVAALFSAPPVQVQTPRTVVTTQASTGQPVQCQVGGRDLGINGGSCTWSHETAAGGGGFDFGGLLSDLGHVVSAIGNATGISNAVACVDNPSWSQCLQAAGKIALNLAAAAVTDGGSLAAEEGGAAAAEDTALTAAQNEAAALRAAKAAGELEGRLPTATAAAVDRTTGEVVGIGHSGDLAGPPTGMEDVLPKPSLEPWSAWNCAEVAACGAALEAGSSLEDLIVATVRTLTGGIFLPCDNCQVWLPGR